MPTLFEHFLIYNQNMSIKNDLPKGASFAQLVCARPDFPVLSTNVRPKFPSEDTPALQNDFRSRAHIYVPMRRIKELLAEVHDVLLDICYG